MITKRNFFLAGILLLLLSCVEEVPITEDRFIKIYGKELASNGKAIIERANGELLLLGDVGVPAFDFTNVGGNVVVGKVSEQSPAIIVANPEGNQKFIRSFPIAQMDMGIISADIQDRGQFISMVENDDGSYFAIGEWSGMDIYVGPPVDFTIDFDTYRSKLPFYARLTSSLEIIEIHSFNGEAGWDEILHQDPVLKKAPDGDVVIMNGIGATYQSPSPNCTGFPFKFEGFSILKMNSQGDTILYKNYYPQDNVSIKMGRDFLFDEEGNIYVFGQRNSSLVIFVVEKASDYSELGYYNIDGLGQPCFYANDLFILNLSSNEIGVIYSDAPDKVQYVKINNSQKSTPINISLELDEYARAAIRAENGDIIVYTELVSTSKVPKGYLYRLTSSGTRKFRVEIDGIPGDVKETSDGSLLVLHNPIYNSQLPKMTLTKLSADGNLY